MREKSRQAELIVFAGPNGSGKSTIARLARIVEPYINADDIKRTTCCSDLEAAQLAESLREDALARRIDFTFETVMSTRRNLDLMARAKAAGYFLRCIYVLTADPSFNIMRVISRAASGGHGVPEDKIRSRYHRALALVPEIVDLCDVMHIYDNTKLPCRIFKKRKSELFVWPSDEWSEQRIHALVGRDRFC